MNQQDKDTFNSLVTWFVLRARTNNNYRKLETFSEDRPPMENIAAKFDPKLAELIRNERKSLEELDNYILTKMEKI